MNLGMPEMIFIFLLALVVFGPRKLPELGRQLGKALAEFKKASNEFKNQLETEMLNIELEERAKTQAKTEPNQTAELPAAEPDSPKILPPEKLEIEKLFDTVSGPPAGTVSRNTEPSTPELPPGSNGNGLHSGSPEAEAPLPSIAPTAEPRPTSTSASPDA